MNNAHTIETINALIDDIFICGPNSRDIDADFRIEATSHSQLVMLIDRTTEKALPIGKLTKKHSPHYLPRKSAGRVIAKFLATKEAK